MKRLGWVRPKEFYSVHSKILTSIFLSFFFFLIVTLSMWFLLFLCLSSLLLFPSFPLILLDSFSCSFYFPSPTHPFSHSCLSLASFSTILPNSPSTPPHTHTCLYEFSRNFQNKDVCHLIKKCYYSALSDSVYLVFARGKRTFAGEGEIRRRQNTRKWGGKAKDETTFKKWRKVRQKRRHRGTRTKAEAMEEKG